MFGAGNVSARLGMRDRPTDNGMFMSVVINCVITVPWAIYTLLFGNIQATLTSQVLIMFFIAGLFTTLLGRGSYLASIRRIGSGRAGVYKVTSPVFAALFSVAILGEALGIWSLVGIAIVIASLWYLSVHISLPRSSSNQEVAATQSSQTASGDDKPHMGIALATYSAASFGLGHVFRKIALSQYPSPALGTAISSLVSLFFIVLLTIREGRLREVLRDNFQNIPIYFVGTGVFMTIGLVCQFSALQFAPVYIVSVLTGTEAIFTILLASLFVSADERINLTIVGSALAAFLGVAIIILYG